MILVDTNVWCEFFNRTEETLSTLLSQNQVTTHPIIVGELSVGCLPHRFQTLRDLQSLPKVKEATYDEVHYFIEEHHLWGKGLQWNDVHLLASVLLTSGVLLWTRDKALHHIAKERHVAFPSA